MMLEFLDKNPVTPRLHIPASLAARFEHVTKISSGAKTLRSNYARDIMINFRIY